MPVSWTPEVVIDAARRASLRGVTRAAEVVREEAIRLIKEGPKTGRLYRRRSVTHQASAPGEPPASDTGNLVRGITVEIDSQKLTARVASTAEYASALEFGTPKMEPRPYMRVALENKRKEVAEILQAELSAELST
jgi:HK97 gp10 family phage protein